MEYPTLFTAGTRWLAPRGVTTPEGVTVHEAGHQFWYGIVGNNEFEHAWMDEGFNTFSTGRAIEATRRSARTTSRGATSAASCRGSSRDIRVSRARSTRTGWRATAPSAQVRRAVDAVVAVLPVDRRRHHLQQDGAVAAHARAIPRAGRRCSGSCPRYFARWKFRHPKPQDFFAVVERGSRPRPDVVLRPGLPQLERVRLRHRAVDERAGARPGFVDRNGKIAFDADGDRSRRSAPRSSCGATARPCSRWTCW